MYKSIEDYLDHLARNKQERSALDRAVEHAVITASEAGVLLSIGSGITQQARIADRVGMRQQNVFKSVRNLIKRKLITSEKVSNYHVLDLTRDGKDILEKITRTILSPGSIVSNT